MIMRLIFQAWMTCLVHLRDLQGEYLAPEKIEGIYVRSPVVAQAFVDGDSLQVRPAASR